MLQPTATGLPFFETILFNLFSIPVSSSEQTLLSPQGCNFTQLLASWSNRQLQGLSSNTETVQTMNAVITPPGRGGEYSATTRSVQLPDHFLLSLIPNEYLFERGNLLLLPINEALFSEH
jgi:hypothetical protein